jgi:site-specific recombinase XerD
MKDVVGIYLSSLRRSPRRLGRATIAKRTAIVRRYTSDVPRWRTATFRDVESWVGSLPVAASTAGDYVSHVRMFYRWAIREGFVDRDPTGQVELPRRSRYLPRPARDGAIRVAIAAAPPDVAAMLILMSGAGLRCCEVARLEWGDVDLIGGTIRVQGKGGRDRILEIGPPVRRALAAIDGTARTVFVSTSGRSLSPCRVSQIVNAHLRRCAAGCTAHQLRHRYATVALELCGDITIVRDLLGHRNVSTTQIYAQVARGAAGRVGRSVPVPGFDGS